MSNANHRDFNLPAGQGDDLWFIHGFRSNPSHFVVDSHYYEWIDGFNFGYRKGSGSIIELFSHFPVQIIFYLEIPLAWYIPGWVYGYPFMAIPPSVYPRQVSEGEQFQVEYVHYYDYYYFYYIVFMVFVSFAHVTLARAGWNITHHHEADRFDFGTKDSAEEAGSETLGPPDDQVKYRLAGSAEPPKDADPAKKYDLHVEYDESGEPARVQIHFKSGSSPSSDFTMWDELMSELKEAVGYQRPPTGDELAEYLGDLGLQMVMAEEFFNSPVEKMLMNALLEGISSPIPAPAGSM